MSATAFDILKQDHQKVKGILAELLSTSSTAKVKRRELLNHLKEELKLHENIEETLVYPPLKTKNSTRDLALEAYEEHHTVDHLLEELEDTDFKDETWKAKLTVLQENLYHHITEEEEELFPRASKELGQEKLEEMAKGIKKMKAE